MLRNTKPWLLLTCVIFIVNSSLLCKAEEKIQEHEIACKVMYIQRALIRADLNTINLGMISFVNSDKYESIADEVGRKTFKEAFEATRDAIRSYQEGDFYNGGRIIAKGNIAIGKACSYYGFEECKNFAGKSGAEVNQFFIAINKLADCGEKLWFPHR